jgi:hypothetical protein
MSREATTPRGHMAEVLLAATGPPSFSMARRQSAGGCGSNSNHLVMYQIMPS